MTTAAIEFKEVTKVYRRRLAGQEVPALTHVSFEVGAGEVCAFLGPNGAGKTTSINILMGFLYADWGEIRAWVRARRRKGQAEDRVRAGEFCILQTPERREAAAVSLGAGRRGHEQVGWLDPRPAFQGAIAGLRKAENRQVLARDGATTGNRAGVAERSAIAR